RWPERISGLPLGVRTEKWDGHTIEGWHSLVNGADAIVNLAGENISSARWTDERKLAILQSRLNAGHAVVEAVRAAARKPRVVIQASGIGYYGPCGDEEITEGSPPGHDFLARLAVDWEASTAPVEALGVRRAIIRTGVVLSKEGGALPRMLLPFRFFIGGCLGSGRQWFPWIHITDEVSAIRFLIENESASGPFNLTAPAPVTNGEFSRLLGQCLRRPALIPTPALALRLLFGELSTALLDGQRAIPQRLLQLGFAFRFPDARSVLSDLLD
ncbi:MAG: TIGR01777 family oxidoreductase, partial [Dehalococcoidales bacterium]|nr:TIGR01777 family oxidoreductase [Dehalococcoidales bacterium]